MELSPVSRTALPCLEQGERAVVLEVLPRDREQVVEHRPRAVGGRAQRLLEVGHRAVVGVEGPQHALDLQVRLLGRRRNWGIVLEGSITIEHADGSFETARAGEVYHWPAGHTGTTTEPCTFLEVGPVAEMRAFSEHAKALFAPA